MKPLLFVFILLHLELQTASSHETGIQYHTDVRTNLIPEEEVMPDTVQLQDVQNQDLLHQYFIPHGHRLYWDGRALRCCRHNRNRWICHVPYRRHNLSTRIRHGHHEAPNGHHEAPYNERSLATQQHKYQIHDIPINDGGKFEEVDRDIGMSVVKDFSQHEDVTHHPHFSQLLGHCQGGRLYQRGSLLCCCHPSGDCFVLRKIRKHADSIPGTEHASKLSPRLKCADDILETNEDDTFAADDDEIGLAVPHDFREEEEVTHYSQFKNILPCCRNGQLYARGDRLCCCHGLGRCYVIRKLNKNWNPLQVSITMADNEKQNHIRNSRLISKNGDEHQNTKSSEEKNSLNSIPQNEKKGIVLSLPIARIVSKQGERRATATLRRVGGAIGLVQLSISQPDDGGPATVQLTGADDSSKYNVEIGLHSGCGALTHDSRPLTVSYVRGNHVKNKVDLTEKQIELLQGKSVTVTSIGQDEKPTAYACGTLYVLPPPLWPLKI